jgi:transglutaminase-like putative cysteine protease
MDSTGKTPDYAYQTSLGTKLGYQNLVYMYSMILDYYKTSGKTADYAIMKPWSVVTTTASGTVGDPSVAPSTITVAPSGTNFTVAQVKDAASRVRVYIEANKKLPTYVQISTYNVNMNQFLEMLATALQQINSGTNNPITVKSFSAPTSPQDSIVAGNILKSEYLKIANDVKNYMDSTGKTPDYAYQTSLGTKLGFQNLVYMYSMILDYHKTSGKMADYAIMKPWSVVSGTSSGSSVPAELLQYIKASANCQVDNQGINNLAAAIVAGKTSTYDKAAAIFNWVRDNIGYSFYYNTYYGAVGTLNAGTGNCVDTAHLLIALERAAGIPARYVHGYAQFSSGSWYGHVWSEIFVDGRWIVADASSNYNSFGAINNWNTGTATVYNRYISLPF